MFEFAGVSEGKKLAVHPMAKAAILKGIASDAPFEVDGNFYTAQYEHTIPQMMPKVLEALK